MQILTGHKARVAALEENLRARRDGEDGQDGTTEIDVRPDDEAVKALQEKIIKLEAETRLKPKNDTAPTPAAIGKLLQEVKDCQDNLEDFRRLVAEQLAAVHRKIIDLERLPAELIPPELRDISIKVESYDERMEATGELCVAALNAVRLMGDKIGRLETDLREAKELEQRRWADFPRELATMQQQLSRVK